MKKIILFILLSLIVGCCPSNQSNLNNFENKELEILERYYVFGHVYYKVKLDEHLYICGPAHHTFTHLESCPCKTTTSTTLLW